MNEIMNEQKIIGILSITSCPEKINELIIDCGLNTSMPLQKIFPLFNINSFIIDYKAEINIYANQSILVVEFDLEESIKRYINFLILIYKTEPNTEISYTEYSYATPFRFIKNSGRYSDRQSY